MDEIRDDGARRWPVGGPVDGAVNGTVNGSALVAHRAPAPHALPAWAGPAAGAPWPAPVTGATRFPALPPDGTERRSRWRSRWVLAAAGAGLTLLGAAGGFAVGHATAGTTAGTGQVQPTAQDGTVPGQPPGGGFGGTAPGGGTSQTWPQDQTQVLPGTGSTTTT
ncbi:hypothetical protein [Kineococcus arenarius]|uniref:hypothetical protein n=1 Tax=unclassified Kineococcus TaxID=2621656 RepID=UPI003D7C5B97